MASTAVVIPVSGQITSAGETTRVEADSQINLFAKWEDDDPIDGMQLELPSGWTLQRVSVLFQGYEPVPVKYYPLGDFVGRYRITSEHALRGYHDIALTVEIGEQTGVVYWTLMPLVKRARRISSPLETRPGLALTQSLKVEPASRSFENRVLLFDKGENDPILLNKSALPKLDTQSNWTIEGWMKTTTLDEVVISAWDGDERTSYPVEIVVDGAGHLFYYRGQPGEHQSMMTSTPIADGGWHHFAVAQNGDERWCKLYLDGVAQDSLFAINNSFIDLTSDLALGGRLPIVKDEDVPTLKTRSFAGELDEIRIWPSTRSRSLLQANAAISLKADDKDAVILNFEEDLPDGLVHHLSERAKSVFSDLIFFDPVHNLRAHENEGVISLTWETRDQKTIGFEVERSADGELWEDVANISQLASEDRNSGDMTPYEYQDLDFTGTVVYYRIRQEFENVPARYSSTVKIGLGAPALPAKVELVGNFPNPFNSRTTITYEVREPVFVKVTVTDLSGQLVSTLVNAVQSPGYFEIPFEADNLPSGTYFIHLQTDSRQQTRKMVLSK